MRGRRAAMKDEKHHSAAVMSSASSAAAAAAAAAATAHAMASDAALLAAKPKAAARATPSRQKTRAVSPVVKSEKAGAAPASVADAPSSAATAAALAPAVVPTSNVAPLPAAMLDLQPAPLSLDSDDSVGKLDGLDLAAAMNLHGVNNDDLVAASLHNFQMSQRYQSSHALNGGVPLGAGSSGLYPPTTVSQTISPANHAMYTASNGYSVNTVAPPPPSAYTPLGAHGYSAMGPSYAMANSYNAPPQSQMAMQTSSGMPFYSGGMPPNVRALVLTVRVREVDGQRALSLLCYMSNCRSLRATAKAATVHRHRATCTRRTGAQAECSHQQRRRRSASRWRRRTSTAATVACHRAACTAAVRSLAAQWPCQCRERPLQRHCMLLRAWTWASRHRHLLPQQQRCSTRRAKSGARRRRRGRR